MRDPRKALRSGHLQQALKHSVSLRKAAKEAGIPYSTAWRMSKALEQLSRLKRRRRGSLQTLDDKAAYDLLGEHTAACAAVQLYKNGRVPKVLHKTTIIRAAKRHALLLSTTLRYLRGPPQEGAEHHDQDHEIRLCQRQYEHKLEAGSFH
jgi:hypothetical protein